MDFLGRCLCHTFILLAISLACSVTESNPVARIQLSPEIRPAFFFADDVPTSVRGSLESAFDAAITEWGNFGPIEYWVVGADTQAAERLADRFCEHRVQRGDLSRKECEEYGQRRAEFVEWASRAEEMVISGQPFIDAGWNGGLEWGLHLFSSSYPPGWAGLEDARPEDDQTVLFHEYFHAIQNAHLDTLDWSERQELMGPVWWVEGGAEFMAQVTTSRLRASGGLPTDQRAGRDPWSSAEAMRHKLERGLSLLSERPGLKFSDVGYGPDANIAYDLGSWGVAWLCQRAGEASLLETFYPRLQELGWNEAFAVCFGMTPAEFYGEFDSFLASPQSEQLLLLEHFF